MCNKIKPMGVTLRKKPNSDNTLSTYYLDIYHNKKRNYIFLKHLKHIEKPKNAFEREQNKECERLAKKIKVTKEHELESNEYNITPAHRQHIDFIEFYQHFIDNYTKKDKRLVEAALKKFKDFMSKNQINNLSTKQLSESIIYDYKIYLEENLNGESPANYFKKFKMVLKYGVRKKIFLSNPAQDITIKKKESIKKDILTIDEIKLLANTSISNSEVKKAFLFSLFTGLRFSDINNLSWKNIDLKNKRLKFTQLKTNESVDIQLHTSALSILNSIEKKDDLIFNLPSHTACLKNLEVWVKKAGINKHITWHCARHSFATNIIFYGADVKSASGLLGHNSLRYTERYTHIVESLKQKAIDNIPEVNII